MFAYWIRVLPSWYSYGCLSEHNTYSLGRTTCRSCSLAYLEATRFKRHHIKGQYIEAGCCQCSWGKIRALVYGRFGNVSLLECVALLLLRANRAKPVICFWQTLSNLSLCWITVFETIVNLTERNPLFKYCFIRIIVLLRDKYSWQLKTNQSRR